MRQLNFLFFFLPAVTILLVVSALLHECLTRGAPNHAARLRRRR